MFVSWVQSSAVQGGISSLVDVRSESPIYGDKMESFMFAETLKLVCIVSVRMELTPQVPGWAYLCLDQ